MLAGSTFRAALGFVSDATQVFLVLLASLFTAALVLKFLRRQYRSALAWPELLFFYRYLIVFLCHSILSFNCAREDSNRIVVRGQGSVVSDDKVDRCFNRYLFTDH